MADEYKDVWVYIEHKEGVTTPMSYELLGAGKMLADTLGSKVCAFVIGEKTEEIAKDAGHYGAATVYAVDGASFKTFRPDVFAKAAASLVNKFKPDIVLYRSTTQGQDLSAAMAARLEVGLGSDAIDLQIDAVETQRLCSNSNRLLLTLRLVTQPLSKTSTRSAGGWISTVALWPTVGLTPVRAMWPYYRPTTRTMRYVISGTATIFLSLTFSRSFSASTSRKLKN